MASDIWLTKGRRAERNAREAKYVFMVRDTNDSARLQPMGSRKIRKERRGRPIYYHGIPVNPPHKQVIAAMLVIDRPAAMRWQKRVNTARAVVDLGLSIKLFLKNIADDARDLRHAELKATGKWVTHVRK
jgi:hypothetical protein